MSENDNYEDERNGLWFWIPLILILLVLFFIIRSCSNDDKLWQSSDSVTNPATAIDKTLDNAASKVKSATETVGDAAKSATNTVADATSSAASKVGTAASNVGNAAGDLAGSTLNAAKSASETVGDVVKGTGKAAATALDKAGSTAKSAINTTENAAAKLGTAAIDTAGNVIESGKSTATAAVDITKNAARKTANAILNIPKDVLHSDIINRLNTGKLVAGKHYNVGTLHFNTSHANISSEDQAKLNAVAQIVKSYPSTIIHLHGHTDATGSEDFNVSLSSQRAKEAKRRLIAIGVPAQQIETHGHGSSNPVASNNTAQGRWQNRRTEIEIQQ